MRFRSTLRSIERRVPTPPQPLVITWYNDATGLPTLQFGPGWEIWYDDHGNPLPEGVRPTDDAEEPAAPPTASPPSDSSFDP